MCCILCHSLRDCVCFQVDPFEKPKKHLFLYELLVALTKEEETVIHRVMESEAEVQAGVISV